MYAKMVYVASALRADNDCKIRVNMELAKGYVEEINVLCGVRAVAPHAFLPEMLDEFDPRQRALGLEFGIRLMEFCHLLVVVTVGGRISEGMAAEIGKASKIGIPVVYVQSEHISATRNEWLSEMKEVLM